MSTEYIVRTTGWTVVPAGSELSNDMITRIIIVDHGTGEFVEVIQPGGGIRIGHHEWPALRTAINEAISGCRPAKDKPE